jgi:hypothetical protein
MTKPTGAVLQMDGGFCDAVSGRWPDAADYLPLRLNDR